ncbi:MAG: tyrosine-type recombinase/integrase [Victivallaceae bacterium]
MSVYRRKTTAGLTEEYHYRFVKRGKDYHGVCEGCHTEEEALAYEASIRKTADGLAAQKSVRALVENFRDELSGGDRIKLEDAFSASCDKPKRKKASDVHMATKSSMFSDFAAFARKKFPEVVFLSDVRKTHAEAYISQLRNHGRFDKKIVFRNSSRGGPPSKYKNKCEKLSPSTVNRFHKTLREVFSLLASDAGLLENPFAGIPMLDEAQETRDAFTEKELELILSKAPPFIRSIFMIGFFTAFREGDIATLRWSDVIWEHGIIRRKILKTGVVVEIPIMPPLMEFLKSQYGIDQEYVLPEHAKMYLGNPSGISYRVKQFLESLGIVTTRNVPGRSRAVSVKDVHSLRHTFCYFSGISGIPLVVVQSIVGHMTKDMTSHYMAHANRDDKRAKLAMLPEFSSLVQDTRRANLTAQTKEVLMDKINAADDATLDRVAAILLKPKPKRLPPYNTSQEKST